MSSSLSGRPLTSEIRSSSKTSHLPEAAPVPAEDGVFIPHVFDFVSLANTAFTQVSSRVPPLFLGPVAVDHSSIIGNGASFSAFKRPIPAAPASSFTTAFEGLRITASGPQQERPKYVVYKVARVAFNDMGQPTPNTRRAMKAAMMELYALGHRPLLNHPNIVDLISLAWGSNYFNPTHRLPVLVVEYADHGNLAQLQENEDLQPSTRASLAIDIGEGLKILHKCGIIHGDVKSENVLIFSHKERKYTAKVADFGFSLVGEAASADIYLGGTRPWKAPEAKVPIAKHLLKATDVYSYGLLLWRLATDGNDPFRFWTLLDSKGNAYLEDLERNKEADEPLKNTALERWFFSYLKQTLATRPTNLSPSSMMQLMSTFQHTAQSLQAAQNNPSTTPPISYSTIMDIFRFYLTVPSFPTEYLSRVALTWAQTDVFYGKVSSAMNRCLSVDPLKRDLDEAVQCLKTTVSSNSNMGPVVPHDILLRTSYDHHTLSWQSMRNLEPAVQAFIFERFKAKVRDNELNQVINPPDCFILTSYYINAYGTGPDFQEAIRLISMSSKKQYDHWQSRAYEYRICSALDPSFKPSEETEHNLFESAISGSRTALEDMKTVSPEKYPKAKSLLRELMCGVGANFFFPDQMLAGFTVWQWINTFNDLAIMVSNLRKLNRIVDYKVNKRGDGILHLAAALGKTDAIQSLLDSFPALTVNMPNGQGETPLLHACRAGQSETVRKLLALGGDASISTPAGESCLHWLVSFGDDEVPLIGQALIEAGADIRRQTRKRISYSIFPATIDVDFQLPGTPLAWAVHNNRPCIVKFLIEKAKDAMVCLDWPKDLLGPGSPVEMAALYHHVDCLIIMVDAMEEAKLGFTYGPFIQRATHAADTFSTILRHGCKYKDMLKATFDFLLERSKPATFSTGIGGFGLSLLFFAISAAHDTVVEYLLSPHLEALLGPFEQVVKVSYPGAYHPNDINRPCGDSDLTPLLEAVRWNRKHIVELLLAHGADPLATGRNPFSRTQKDWTALHVFANAGHNTDTSLVRILVEKGLPADGRVNHSSEKTPSEEHTTIPAKSGMICVETPLLVAIQNNAFNLATLFLDLGADPNALCLSSGLVTLPHPTTVLGHLIAASAQHTTSRLRYLIMDSPTNDKLDFIVTPSKNLSAIHLAARAHKDVWHRSSDEGDKSRPVSRKDYDMVVNEEIMQELLLRWGGEAHLNLKSGVEGGTALHLAVDAGNVEAVRLLVEKGADTTVTDDFGLTPAELGKALLKTGGLDMQLQEAVSRIDSYLEGVLHGM